MVNVEKISLKEYLIDFQRSYNNFISKCPLKVKTSIVQETGRLYIEILDSKGKSVDGFDFVVNPSIEKQVQIREIKEKLEVFYPIIYQEVETQYDAEQIEEFMKQGISLTDALKKRLTSNNKKYKIIRAHHKFNELDCYDYATSKVMKFKLKFKDHYYIPTATFLEKLSDDPQGMSKEFYKAFEFKFILG